MGKPGERVVVYASTRNQYDKMEAAAKSLLLTNVVDKVYFLTEDRAYPTELPSCIETIDVTDIKDNYFYEGGPNYHSIWTYMTLMRTTLYDMFPQYDRVLYLDTDTVVIDDISELFTLDLGDHYFAAVCDDMVCLKTRYAIREDGGGIFREQERVEYVHNTYYNAGVLVCNSKALRDGKGKEILRLVNTEPFMFAEQDAINVACRGKILDIPSDYNVAVFTAMAKKPKIYHLSATKDQRLQDTWQTYLSMDWNWVKKQMDINQKREEETMNAWINTTKE